MNLSIFAGKIRLLLGAFEFIGQRACAVNFAQLFDDRGGID